MSFRPASSALSDLVVLDLTRVRSGPTCVREFADWGANVIKIEAPAGDPRAISPRHIASRWVDPSNRLTLLGVW